MESIEAWSVVGCDDARKYPHLALCQKQKRKCALFGVYNNDLCHSLFVRKCPRDPERTTFSFSEVYISLSERKSLKNKRGYQDP